MKPVYYVNFDAQRMEASLITPSISRLLLLLHRRFRDKPETFALAFPLARSERERNLGDAIRVFAGERDHIDALLDDMEREPVVRDYFLVSRVRRVPDDYSGPTEMYLRFRVPGKRSRLTSTRSKRLIEAESFPFAIVPSRSTGQTFSLHVKKIPGGPLVDARPDSYGLAVPTRPFSVPAIPM